MKTDYQLILKSFKLYIYNFFNVMLSSILLKLLILLGVVPQQPPIILILLCFFINSYNFDVISSGDIKYFALPFSFIGIPALGITKIGNSFWSQSHCMLGVISTGPVEQFSPNMSMPKLLKVTYAD